jgi:hypothetical protein
MYVNYHDPMNNKQTKILVQTDEIDLPCGIFGGDGYFISGSKNIYESIKIPLEPTKPGSIDLRKTFKNGR